ncbi:unnamed protein product [Rotaria socialis]|uniref:Uncharacterized protein n=1 Tax=Rotaria socialis TaxID=392032 RepID=A0A818GU62_9BILA|nr:unnamed protein product [Rotaria socialis]
MGESDEFITNMELDKEYLFVFRDIKYTNNQKLLNKRISGQPSQNELLKYYADPTLDDINDMEKLEKIEDRIKVLKWYDIIYDYLFNFQ